MLRGQVLSVVVLGLVVSVLAGRAAAQPLVDRMPHDARVYVGWPGVADMGEGFGGSHAQAVLEASRIRAFVSEALPRMVSRYAAMAEAPGGQMLGAFLGSMGKAMWEHPTAVYVGGVKVGEGAAGTHPMARMEMRVAVICRAGKQAEELAGMWSEKLPRAAREDKRHPVQLKAVGEHVILTVGHFTLAQQEALGLNVNVGRTAPKLGMNGKFARMLEKTQAKPAAMVYVDVEQILADAGAVRTAQMAWADEYDAALPWLVVRWPEVMSALGLDGLKTIAVTGGFDGKQWATRAFIEAPSPRRGLVSLLDGEPVSKELLAAIPATASIATVQQLDLAELVDEIQSVLSELDEDAARDFERELGGFREQVGKDVVEDLLRPFGPQWAWYVDANVGGLSLEGSVLVNRLRDEQKAREALAFGSMMASSFLQMGSEKLGVSLRLREAEVDGVRVHYLALPVLSVSWAIRDGNLYAGLHPEVVVAAAKQVSEKRPSIAGQAKLAGLRKQTGAGGFTRVTYTDPELLGPMNYGAALGLARLALGASDLAGVEETPAVLMPPLRVLREHMTPSASFVWADDSGIYYRGVEAFPGSGLVAGSQGLVGLGRTSTVASMVGILMPALEAARNTARTMQGSVHARALMQYAVDWGIPKGNRYPPNLEVLIEGPERADPLLFLHPESGRGLPGGFDRWPVARQKTWLGANSDWVYVAAGKSIDTDSRRIVLYQKPETSKDSRVTVVWGDAHVTHEPVSLVLRIAGEYDGLDPGPSKLPR